MDQALQGNLKSIMSNLKNSLLLLLAAFIWGTAFVAQSVGMDYVGPFTFSFSRNIVGGLVLIPAVFLMDKWKERSAKNKDLAADPEEDNELSWRNPSLWKGGVICGIALCVAANFQQVGLQYTTVGKSGFITALYIVLVPLLGILLKKRLRAVIWISVVLAVIGLYLLCMSGSFSLDKGDALTLASALSFAVQILCIDHFAPKTDPVKLCCVEFFVCGILSGMVMLITETVTIDALVKAAVPILYAGVLSSGVAYTLQAVGQRNLDPAIASLLMSMESVFSVLAGWVVLGQTLSFKEIAGCMLMFAAIILAQLPEKKKQEPVRTDDTI